MFSCRVYTLLPPQLTNHLSSCSRAAQDARAGREDGSGLDGAHRKQADRDPEIVAPRSLVDRGCHVAWHILGKHYLPFFVLLYWPRPCSSADHGTYWQVILAAYRHRVVWIVQRDDAPTWAFWNFTLFVATAASTRLL